jgi:hypothetical protein
MRRDSTGGNRGQAIYELPAKWTRYWRNSEETIITALA